LLRGDRGVPRRFQDRRQRGPAAIVAVHAVEALLAAGKRPAGAGAFTVGEEGFGNLRGTEVAEACSTDANAALALGIPALALGVAVGAGMHSLEERIETAALELGRAQLLGVLRRLLA
jgi:hypothetical protein